MPDTTFTAEEDVFVKSVRISCHRNLNDMALAPVIDYVGRNDVYARVGKACKTLGMGTDLVVFDEEGDDLQKLYLRNSITRHELQQGVFGK